MKTRIGFVSNSSSSSFIIAAKPMQSLKAKMEIDITRYVQDEIATIKDLEEYILEEHAYNETDIKKVLEDDYAKSEYDMIYEYIQKGFIVYRGSFSSEDGGEEAFLCDEGADNLEFIDNVIVVEGEGGY